MAYAAIAAAVIGGLFSNNASRRARGSQLSAIARQDAIAEELRRLTEQDEQGGTDAYNEGLGQLRNLLGPGGTYANNFSLQDFQEDPGYQFRMQQGQLALERAAAARGSQLSGAQIKSLSRYNQGVAAQEYGAAFDRFQTQREGRLRGLTGLTAIGDAARARVANARNEAARVRIGGAGAAGNVNAASSIAQANNLNSTLGSLAGIFSREWGSNSGGN